jgi:hypothetical protein
MEQLDSHIFLALKMQSSKVSNHFGKQFGSFLYVKPTLNLKFAIQLNNATLRYLPKRNINLHWCKYLCTSACSSFIHSHQEARHKNKVWWFTPIIQATQETEIGGSGLKTSPGKKKFVRTYLKKQAGHGSSCLYSQLLHRWMQKYHSWGQPGQKCEILSEKQTKKVGGMVQVKSFCLARTRPWVQTPLPPPKKGEEEATMKRKKPTT